MTATHDIAPDELRIRLRRFRSAYAAHRAREGRGSAGELAALPYVATGPQATQWRVRARTFDHFVARVLQPLARELCRPITVLDLGAGNGWLCYRVGRLGHRAIAVDFRTDAVDGLGAARGYGAHLPSLFPRVGASFEALPLPPQCADAAVFNASLHYAIHLAAALQEATRVVAPGGRVVILDSPFYPTSAAGEAMIREKEREATRSFGDLAPDLSSLPFVEYLTRERLVTASGGRLIWRRHRVRYPLAYQLRPLIALLRGARRPSRFDLWEGRVAPVGLA
jgi:SAM-dependent methyltransferase